jgi:hypothetical protein
MEKARMTQASRPTDERAEIAALRRQHQALDATVRAMESHPSPDQLQIAQVKKRKLALRDRIIQLEDQTTPDLIA